MKISEHESKNTDDLTRAIAMIGDKWTILITGCLAAEPRRYCEMKQMIRDISPRTLSVRLKYLEHHRFVMRTQYADFPCRVEYHLTDKGKNVLPIIECMRDFGEHWLGR